MAAAGGIAAGRGPDVLGDDGRLADTLHRRRERNPRPHRTIRVGVADTQRAELGHRRSMAMSESTTIRNA